MNIYLIFPLTVSAEKSFCVIINNHYEYEG